jgi:hypothetical protein
VPAGTPKLLLGVNLARESSWVTGQVADDVATVDVVFDDGHVETVTPTNGFVLLPLAAGTTSEASSVAKIVGRDTSGRQVAVYRPG